MWYSSRRTRFFHSQSVWSLLESSLSGVKSPEKVRKIGKNREKSAYYNRPLIGPSWSERKPASSNFAPKKGPRLRALEPGTGHLNWRAPSGSLQHGPSQWVETVGCEPIGSPLRSSYRGSLDQRKPVLRPP